MGIDFEDFPKTDIAKGLDWIFLHEFGHQIGLYHEHQRPDREEYAHFNCSAFSCIKKERCYQHDCCSHLESDCGECYQENFGPPLVDHFQYRKGKYDFDNVMHYEGDACAKPD